MILKLLAFVPPLGLDSFAVAAAIGAAETATTWQRLRISLIFVLFEGGMPLIGLGLGGALGISSSLDEVAIGFSIGLTRLPGHHRDRRHRPPGAPRRAARPGSRRQDRKAGASARNRSRASP